MSQVTNTSLTPSPEWLSGGNPNAILQQEAQGQNEFVNSAVLPKKINGGNRAEFEAIGIVFHDPVEGDPLFINCTLPQGWTKQKTDHSMWSNLVDEQGKIRATIFYKAAFYDRDAFMSLES